MFSLREEITKTLLRFRREDGVAASAGIAQDEQGPDLRVSRQYGSYRILRLLGAGGMGRVYLALDTRLGRHVALKFLPGELARDSEFLRRFEQEARTASMLSHPNIVTIYDFTEIAGDTVLVSEFIEGATLRSVLDRRSGVIDAAATISISAQAASALVAAHDAGIVHRDLKPSNIMLRPDGYVKVIDFGLAKFTVHRRGSGAPLDFTRPGSVLGTVDYLSPEQARGDQVDARTDLWSLGVVMYEMIAQRRPFGGDTDSHVIVDILDRKPLPLPQTGEFAPELIRIIERALEKDRKRRYQSARELLADLQHLQRTPLVPVSGSVLVPPAKAGKLKDRVRYSLAGVAAAALLVCAFWWWGMHGKERVLGPKWFEFASTRRVTFEGDVASAVISPDGKYLAYVAGQGLGRLRLRNLASGTESSLPAAPGSYVGLSFSPDGKTLYYVLRQGEIGRVFASPVVGFADTPGWILLENADGPLAFSPTGNEFAFRRNTTERNRANNSILLGTESNPRNARTLVSLAGTQIRDELAWSPKNDWIAAVTYPSHLNTPTRATVSLFDRNGRVLRSFVPRQLRSLYAPIALDGGSLLLFSGFPEGSVQRHLVELYVPTGEFHEVATDLPGFESISVTSDSRTLASVRMDRRSAIWEAEADDLQHPRKLTRDSEPIPGVRWVTGQTSGAKDEQEMVYPSSRTENLNLALLKEDGSVAPLGTGEDCVEEFPVSVPGRPLVIYAANCAHGGDDFNLWTLDRSTGRRRALTSGSSYDYQPDVSPDGNWIVYTSWSSDVASLWKIPVDGGIPEALSREQGKLPFFSPDGKRIVAQTRDPFTPWRVDVLDASDGSVLQRLKNIPAGVLPVRWSPDGKALDYIVRVNGTSAIWRQALAGGKPGELLNVGDESIDDFAWNAEGTKIAYVRSRSQRDVVLFYRK